MRTNIDYWNKIVKNPSKVYKDLFKQEALYLKKNISKNEKILDIGCGEGRNILSLVEITKNIVGIDFDSIAVEKSKKNLKEHPEVQILQGDAFDLPFDDNIFDTSILSMTLVNFENKKTDAIIEMKRVTKANGKILISVYSEKAKFERLQAYQSVKLPIKGIEDGKFLFDGEFGANTSEQFSINDIKIIVEPLGLRISHYEEVPNLAYLLTLVNK